MTKHQSGVYSRYTLEALKYFARCIKEARVEQAMTMEELANRAGISRGLLRRIEKGEPTCSIGACFEVAWILSIPLFQSSYDVLVANNKRIQEKIALLPEKVKHKPIKVDDDF